MKKLLALSCLFLLFIFASCSSDSDDDNPIINPPAADIKYSNTISAIISGNCNNCHGATPTNGAPMSLTTYANVKSAVETRNLIGRVENGSMPPNGNLTATQIQNIKTWQANNFPQ